MEKLGLNVLTLAAWQQGNPGGREGREEQSSPDIHYSSPAQLKIYIGTPAPSQRGGQEDCIYLKPFGVAKQMHSAQIYATLLQKQVYWTVKKFSVFKSSSTPTIIKLQHNIQAGPGADICLNRGSWTFWFLDWLYAHLMVMWLRMLASLGYCWFYVYSLKT